MAKSIIDKYSNYNPYIVGADGTNIVAPKIEEERLQNIIESCVKILKKPWIRFMYASDAIEAHCIVYDGENRVTKLISISEVEKMIGKGAFHK